MENKNMEHSDKDGGHRQNTPLEATEPYRSFIYRDGPRVPHNRQTALERHIEGARRRAYVRMLREAMEEEKRRQYNPWDYLTDEEYTDRYRQQAATNDFIVTAVGLFLLALLVAGLIAAFASVWLRGSGRVI